MLQTANLTETGKDYAPKMDRMMSQAVTEWWNKLTKEELLQYIYEQPELTADVIRQLLANENCTMKFTVAFSAATTDATTDFHNNVQ